MQVDYNNLNGNAQNQISGAQSGISGLTTGQLPQGYLDNMTKAIQSSVQNSLGSSINTLGNNGVLNSSVTEKANNDIAKNTADSVAQSYNNNINTLGSLYNNQINNATSGIITAASAQEAAQQPALNRWNASLGLNGSTTSALAAAAGKGTTNSTQTTSGGGGGLLSGLLGGL